MTLLEKANKMTKLEVQSRLVAAWNQEQMRNALQLGTWGTVDMV